MSESFERTMAVGPGAPREARRLVHDMPLGPDARANVALIVSELVTNTVRHGSSSPDGELSVVLRREGDRVSGEVCGHGPEFSWAAHEPELSEPGGLGLLLVDQIADRWGITNNSHVCVWFECADCAPS